MPSHSHGARSQPLYAHLYFQVLSGIALGVLLGFVSPQTGAAMRPLGDGFVRLIKMVIAPIIFGTVVVGIAKVDDMRNVGRHVLLRVGAAAYDGQA